MRLSHRFSVTALVCLSVVGGRTTLAQTPATLPAATRPEPTTRPQRPASPEINASGGVTFRVFAPNAKAVEVWGDWPLPNGGPMTRDETGVWSATLDAIPKGYWGYTFKVDGSYVADHANPLWKTSREVNTSVLDLPGGLPWDRRAGVPHGGLHLHDYESTSLGRTRRLRVYTPPGYERDATARYPVLYLLHGSGDNEAVWTEFGRANVILDNLIADRGARPMIVVMTDGHAVGGGAADSRDKNVDAFSTELLGQVIPMIDAAYRTRTDAASRAIAGLSMGGNQALIIGLHHPDVFAWVGGMSSAIRQPERDLGDLAAPAGAPAGAFRLVWLSCGVEDQFLETNRHTHDVLNQLKITHDYAETPGKHAWPVWRANLVTLVPKLFQSHP